MTPTHARWTWTQRVVLLAMALGAPLALWLLYATSYALWMSAYPFADRQLWGAWFSVPSSAAAVVILLELLGLLWLRRTRRASKRA